MGVSVNRRSSLQFNIRGFGSLGSGSFHPERRTTLQLPAMLRVAASHFVATAGAVTFVQEDSARVHTAHAAHKKASGISANDQSIARIRQGEGLREGACL